MGGGAGPVPRQGGTPQSVPSWSIAHCLLLCASSPSRLSSAPIQKTGNLLRPAEPCVQCAVIYTVVYLRRCGISCGPFRAGPAWQASPGCSLGIPVPSPVPCPRPCPVPCPVSCPLPRAQTESPRPALGPAAPGPQHPGSPIVESRLRVLRKRWRQRATRLSVYGSAGPGALGTLATGLRGPAL